MKRQVAAPFFAYAAVVIACSNNGSARNPDNAPTTDVGQPAINPIVPTETTTWSRCPTDMVEIDGEYCPNVREVCVKWVDQRGVASEAAKPSKRFPTGRCGEWKYPSECVGAKVHKHYCVDTYEYPNVEGQRPQSWMTWYDVKNACEAKGKRLCTKPEWEFACEGPNMQPYPYKGPGEHPGYTRDKTACNFDNAIPEDPLKPIDPRSGKHFPISVFDSKQPHDRVSTILDNLLAPAGSMPACVSPWGVHDMVGNIDEFVEGPVKHHWVPPSRNGGKPDRGPFISGLMSGHVFGVRNQCRAITDGHNEAFGWYETGGRCCSDTPEDK